MLNKTRIFAVAAAFVLATGVLVTAFLITNSLGDSRTTSELPTLMQLPTEEFTPIVTVTDPPPATDTPSPTNTVELAPTNTIPPAPTATDSKLAIEVAVEPAPQSQPVAIQMTLPPLERIVAPTQPPALPLPALPLEPVPNQVIIRFEADASAPMREQYLERIGGTVQQRIDTLNMVVVTVPDGAGDQPLPESPVVVRSEPDYYVAALTALVPDDPLYPQQWALPVIGAPEAWGEFPADAPLVTVAVIDSGICANHPDLAGRTLAGWDFLESDSEPQDDYGHGCGVAGIIAANTNDGVGMAGVAPNARIMPLRVLNAQGIGTYSDVAAAIVYAVDNGAQVINLSLGGAFPSTLLESAIDYAVAQNATVVAAAGNTGGSVLYPAAYAPVIAVASVDPDLQRSGFSSYGPEIDLLAPGRDILTTARDGSYVTASGTSFAAPHVAGAAAVEMAKVFWLGILDGTGSSEAEEAVTPKPNIAPTSAIDLPPTNGGRQLFSPLGISAVAPAGWSTNVYRNVGFGFSFFTDPVVMAGPDSLISGAYITVSIADPSIASEGELARQKPDLAELNVGDYPAFQYGYVNDFGTVEDIVEVDRDGTLYRFELRYSQADTKGAEYTEAFTTLLGSMVFVDFQGELPELPLSPEVLNLAITSLAFPFEAGAEWKITSGGGYNNGNMHAGYALYGLDFVRRDGNTNVIALAPTNGRLDHPHTGYDSQGQAYAHCIDVSIASIDSINDLWLEICHLDFESYQVTGSSITKAEVLGKLATDGCGGKCTLPHIHMAAFVGKKGNPWTSPSTRYAVPFANGSHNLSLDGVSFTPNGSYNQYANTQGLYSSIGPICAADSGLGISGQDVCGNPPPTCPNPNPGSNEVVFFDGTNYSGECWRKGIGDYPNPSSLGIPNDRIESIKVGSNVQVTVCDNDNYDRCSGPFTSDVSDLGNHPIGRNTVSSAKVQQRGSSGSGCGSYSYPGIVLFDNIECGGSDKREYSSAGFRSMPSVDFNDRASSIHVAPGWSVRIWNDDRDNSPSRCISGSMWDLSKDKYDGTDTVINNTITWVEVFWNPSCSRDDSNSVVTLYTNSDLTGTPCSLFSATHQNVCSGSNDTTSSIRIKAGWSARVWNDGDRQGPSRCFYGYVSNLAGEQYKENGSGVIDNTISSFAAYNQSNCPTWPIPAPTNLQATVISTSHINLSWSDNSSDETYFQIERSLNGTQWSSIASTSASTYSSTGLNCGTDYHFRVKAYRNLDTAHSGVSNTVTARTHTCAQPPTNDDFGSAISIASMPFSVTINTTDATKASDDPVPSCATNTGKTVWYRYTPGSNHRILLDTYGSSFNTTLSVWTGSRGSLTQQVCNDDSGGTPQSELNLEVTSGTTYYIMVGGNASATGGSLKLNSKSDGTPPNVQIVSPQPGNALSVNQLVVEAIASDSGSGVKELVFFIGYDDGIGAAGASIDAAGLPQPPDSLEEVNAQGWGWHRWLWDTDGSDGWKVTFDVTGIPEQEFSLWVFAYDYAGNRNQHSFSDVLIDRTPPSSMVAALPASSPLNFTVSWSGNDAVSGISSYDVQLRLNSGAWTDWVTGTTTTSKSVSANGVATYEFRSRARDRAGNVEAWPTNADASTTTAVPAPAVPTGLTTIGNLTSAPASPTYRWNHVANATDYGFGLALSSGQWLHQSSYSAASICSSGMCQVTPQVPLGEGAYYWRVAGINAGTWGNYTPNQHFSVTVSLAAGPFNITYPAANSYVRGAEVQPFFRWTVSSNAHTYEVLLVDRTVGATIYSAYLTPAQLSCGTECVLTSANYPVMLTTQHEYNLRVKAIAPSGDYTATSRFFTLYPGYPQQISPIPGTDLSLQPVMTWAHVEGTDGYRIIIKTLQGVVYGKWGFYAPAQLCSGTTCTFDLRSLPGGGQAFLNYGKYTWQILAVNAYGRVKTDAWYFRVR